MVSVKKAVTKKVVKKVTKKAAPKKPQKAEKPEVDHGEGRKVAYPEIGTTCYQIGKKAGPMTAAIAMQLLGWEEVDDKDGKTLTTDFDLKDHNGKKIRLNNNIMNRPFRVPLARTWESEILHGHWELNGETMIIGRTGLCLDCQHRLVGLVLACQWWESHKEDFKNWKEEPHIECIVVFGISELSRVVDTINTGEPRTLADVIFRDNQYFDDLSKGDRVKVAKITEQAIRMLAHRTAAFRDAFSPNQTHADMIDFLHRHERLLGCVRFITEAETDKSISSVIPMSLAAALMFLMGCSNDDGKRYVSAQYPNDEMLDWSRADDAEKFWESIANNEKKMFAIKEALAAVAQDSESISRAERIGIVVKAWHLFGSGTKLTAGDLALEYHVDREDQSRRLIDHPLVGGIDVGGPKEDEAEATAAAAGEVPVVSTHNVRSRSPKRSKKNDGPLEVGEVVWVIEDPIEASWSGQLSEIAGKNARVIIGEGFARAGEQQAVRVIQLTRDEPEIPASAA